MKNKYDKDHIFNLIYKQNYTLQQVANIYGVSRQHIHQLLKRWGFASLSLAREKKKKPERPSLYERFMQYVEVTPNCWNWTGYKRFPPKGKQPYGVIRATKFTKEHIAYRVAWILFRGDLMPGEWVRHTCNNRLCVNPAHLYLYETNH